MKRFTRFFYHPCLPLGPDNRLATGSPEHIALSREAACEGMVLLKNEGHCLPLAKGTRIAIFGTAQFDYVRGGGGSGDVTTAYTRNIYEGFKLKEADGLVEVYEPLSALYKMSVELQKTQNGANSRCEQPDIPLTIIEDARKFTDTAIMTICRYSWEGGDRLGGADDGDYYLSAGERALRDMLVTTFDHVIIVLDVGGVVDTTWIRNDSRICSALLAWQAGIEGGLAIADTICGLSDPSGRLVDTFADSFTAYPSSEHFNDSKEYADYTEDIFVGYRWFSTFDPNGEHVVYPFGYGLSYTAFSLEMTEVSVPHSLDSDDFTQAAASPVADGSGTGSEPTITVRVAEPRISVSVRVTNTGDTPGKTAVGLYYSAPQGKLGKPARELAAIAKTRLLAPGEGETLVLSYAVRDMASYDDLGKITASSYILEAGSYRLFLGADVQQAEELTTCFEQETTVVVQTLTKRCAPHRLSERLCADGSYEKLPTDGAPVTGRTTVYNEWTVPTGRTIVGDITSSIHSSGTGVNPEAEFTRVEDIPSFEDVAEGREALSDFIAKLPVEVLIEMLSGQPNTGVANTFGMGNFTEYGIPNVMTADGPAGLRIVPGLGVTTTAWPIATMLACTWNTELVERVGAAGGREVCENNIGLWLTPAMNIHRSPLCGRNFEYYSEDPLITGLMGAAMIRGIQSEHVGATMKHFACNNKEEDRFTCDSRVSERALREIYLRGFMIAVREGHPWAVMSSYNLVNGTYSAQNADLLTGILREEWGYDGMVTTDWMNRSGQVGELLAGNDLKMPIGEPKVLLDAYHAGSITREDIERSAGRILATILRFD